MPADDLLGATVVMVQGLYKGKEFVRVGKCMAAGADTAGSCGVL